MSWTLKTCRPQALEQAARQQAIEMCEQTQLERLQ